MLLPSNELLLDYARQSNADTIMKIKTEREIKAIRSKRRGLRDRVLLTLSDLLLAVGQGIRPKKITPVWRCSSRDVVTTT